LQISPIELRHLLHQNPELAYQEFQTTKLIIDAVSALPNFDKRFTIHTPMQTGVLVEYKVNDGNYLLFRADIDALPISEETANEFKSKNENMHACGHDVHTSILFGLVECAARENVNQNILFLFQPAEESGGGAMKFFATGVFKQFNVEKAFALHVTDEFPKGTIASTSGVLFASALEIDIDFHGKSSHVAFPQNGKNAFNALRLFLDAIDKIPKGINDATMFGFGKITSGSVRNIVPGTAKLEGTVRALTMKGTDEIVSRLEKIATGVAQISDVKINITKGAHYPEVIIDDFLFRSLSKIFSGKSEKFTFLDCGYKMTGEDFGYISQQYPSFMFWLGTSTGEQFGLHNPQFLPGDDVIEIGTNAFKQILISQIP
jgi:N-acetyldiaminopimelate deacetylase